MFYDKQVDPCCLVEELLVPRSLFKQLRDLRHKPCILVNDVVVDARTQKLKNNNNKSFKRQMSTCMFYKTNN